MSTLYVVATPIGNLGDMSPRAVDVLRKVNLICAEDTRVTMKLTNHFEIDTPLTSCHQHNEKEKSVRIIQKMLAEDIDVAVVTDAGTPAISDPGTRIVQEAAAAGIPIMAVAGPSAMAAAMSVSGFDSTEFTFYGFLPREKKDLREKLKEMAQKSACAIVHESPYRIRELMETIAEVLPEAMVSASCDLTKLHELTVRGSAAQVRDILYANEKSDKGEYCIVIDMRLVPRMETKKDMSAISLEARLFDQMLNGTDLRDAVRNLQEEGEKKNAVYSASVRVKRFLEAYNTGDES